MTTKNHIKSLLKYVIQAPSGYNTQPWKFKLGQDFLEIIPDYTRARINTDPEYREFFMSLGAAATNFQVAANYFGLSFEKSYRLDDENHDYAIIFKYTGKKEGEPVTSPLFSAISTRHTNRFPYLNEKLSKTIITSLRSLPRPDSVSLNLITRPGDITALAKLINRSFLLWSRQQSMIDELETWIRDDLEFSPNGLPTGVINIYKLAVNVKHLLHFDTPKTNHTLQKNQDLAKNAPALAIISTKADSVSDWFQAGEFFELFALTLASYGFATDFFNYPVALKKTRQEIASLIKSSDFPQLLFRLGLPTIIPPRTSRYPLKQLLLS